MKAIHTTIQEYSSTTKDQFDLIVSNPPFYQDHLQSEGAKNIAIHATELKQEDLLSCVLRLLKAKGAFWVLYPQYQFDQFRLMAERSGLFVSHKVEVFNKIEEKPFRIIGSFSLEDSVLKKSSIVIRNEHDEYTESLKSLTQDYYL